MTVEINSIMKHIKLFEDWTSTELFRTIGRLNETLGSDRMAIAVKKLDSFFNRNGLSKKPIIGEIESDSPGYQIITDRKRYAEGLADTLKVYTQNIQDPAISDSSKEVYADEISRVKKILSELKDLDYETIVINTNFNSEELSRELISLIKSMGYHIVSVGTWNTAYQNRPNLYDPEKRLTANDKICLLAIQPNYGDKVEFKGEYLYHTTDSKYLDKILKYGLVPKTKNSRFFYPGRIFLSPSKEFSDHLKNSLISNRVEKEMDKFSYDEKTKLTAQKEKEWVDLRIKNFNGLTLYRDMMIPPDEYSATGPHEGGFFTYDNIPPEYIEII